MHRGGAGNSRKWQSLFKVTKRTNLTRQELKKNLMCLEIVLKNLPFIYIEQDNQMPVFTSNTLL